MQPSSQEKKIVNFRGRGIFARRKNCQWCQAIFRQAPRRFLASDSRHRDFHDAVCERVVYKAGRTISTNSPADQGWRVDGAMVSQRGPQKTESPFSLIFSICSTISCQKLKLELVCQSFILLTPPNYDLLFAKN